MLRKPQSGLTLLALALLAGSALAQPDSAAAKTGDEADSEIIITARRRPESLQKTPIAVSTLDADTMARRAALSIVDFGKGMPNVRLDAVGPQGRAGMLAIRGVNYSSTNQLGDPSVPLYIDGIYQSLNKLSAMQMFDLEQVDVLRGPQVTLSGRNAFAGAVNMRTRRPQFVREASVALRAGSFGREELQAAVDLPLVDDQLALRLAAMDTRSSGYYRSIRNNGAPLGGEDNTVVRLSGLLKDFHGWNADFKYEQVRDRGEPSPVQNASTPAAQATPATPSQIFGNVPGDPPNFFSYPRYWTNVLIPAGQRSFVDQQSMALTVRRTVAGGELSWTGGHQHTEDGVIVDPTGGRIAYNNQYFRTGLVSISNEIRYLRRWSDRWQTLGGVLWIDDDLDYGNITYSQYAATASSNAQVRALQRRTGLSWFAEAEFRASETVRVNLSGRQMREQKDVAFRRTPRPVALAISPGVFLPVTSYETDSIEWDDFAPAMLVDWQPSPQTMLYISMARGVKSGGYAAQSSSLATAGPFGPERIDTIEAGFKSEWQDGRIRLNAALFRNRLSGLQRQVNRTQDGVLVNRIYNAAAAQTHGAELELEMQTTGSLHWRASLGWLEAFYDSFCANIGYPGGTAGFPPASPCSPTPGELDNSYMPLFNAPKWQGSIGVDWRHDLRSLGRLRLWTDLHHTAALFTEDRPYDLARRSALTLLDLGMEWQTPDARYFVRLNASNVLQDIETQQSIRSGNTLTVLALTPPRQFSVSLGRNF